MNITCTTLEELDDGGAIVQLEMDEQSKVELINIGFVTLLEQYVEQQQAEDYEEDYEEEEEYAEAPDYSDFIAELQTCYEYHMGCDDSEDIIASTAELLIHYMGEEEASEYFSSVNPW
jgi:hypothetical protein